jgi:hypothetical protein
MRRMVMVPVLGDLFQDRRPTGLRGRVVAIDEEGDGGVVYLFHAVKV